MEAEVWYGLVGGCAAEALKWFRLREAVHESWPDYARHWGYWLISAIMVGVGGLLVCIYQASDDVRLRPILAFNIGVSAPLILSSLAEQIPRIERGTID